MNIAIYGYGNLGRGVECAAQNNEDVTLVGVFTRRPPESVKTLTGVPVYHVEKVLDFKDKIDVLIICGGSATDLPKMTPQLAESFNVVDSFDNHSKIPEHFKNVNEAAEKSEHIALISAGWDPGLFSLNRVYAESILPEGNSYTFWGRGVSQGHSDAIRRIDGVLDARQYTVPIEKALCAVRNGENPNLTTGEKHKRECYVVVKEGADKEKIEKEIKEMPAYFADYDTTVNFVTKEELLKNHSELPHGGFVIRTGKTGLSNEHSHVIEYSLKLDSNPEFTASALVAFARAVNRMYQRGERGAVTVLDICPKDLSAKSREELYKNLL